MPSALEIYYRNKGKKPISDPAKRLAAKEFLGMDLPKKNIGYFHKLMDILDRPGNATRALLVGKLGGLKGLIPFAQTIENLTGIDIALNKEEMVYGTEVIEKWFGKQKQRKGKIDPVDVFGFMVEVVADPIWLTGIGGLTKVGKAAKLAQSGIRGAKATGQLNTVRKMIKAAKAGKAFDSTKLSKAFLTVYKSGGKPALAKNWATQAAKGQRALLKFAGKPLIKGEKAFAGLEKIGTKLKVGKVGKVFLAPTRRVPTQYKELHEIYTHFGRDLPHIRRAEYLKRITSLYDKGAKAGKSAKEMDDILRQFVQRAYAREGGARFIQKTVSQRARLAAQKIRKLKPELKMKQKALAAIRKQQEEKIIAKVLSRFPQKVKDQKSLEKIGNAIAKELGFTDEEIKVINWQLLKRKGYGVSGAWRQSTKTMRVSVGEKSFLTTGMKGLPSYAGKPYKAGARVFPGQGNIKRTIVHELGHYRVRPIKGASGRRAVHHPKYVDWVEEGVKKLFVEKAVGVPSKITPFKKGKLVGATDVLEKDIERIGKRIQYQRQYFAKGLRRGGQPIKPIQKVKAKVELRKGQAEQLLTKYPEQAKALKELGEEYDVLGKGMISKELAVGAPAKQIMYPIGYARRTATPEFRAFMEANKHHPVIAGFARDMSTRNAAQRMRNKVLGWMTDDEALDYFRKLGYEGKDVFERGMAMPTIQRAAMSTRTVGAGETIQEAIKKFGKPDMPIWRGKGYTFSAEDLMTKVGMRPEAAAIAKGRVVPNEVASALLDMHNLATSEEALTGFWKTWTRVHRFFKGSFTLPWPAYHTRNMFSNFVLNWIGGVKNPKSYIEALRLQLGKGQPIRLASGAILSPDDILRNADQWGVVRRSLGMFEPSEILPTQFGKRPSIIRGGAKVGMAVEDNARLAHFIEKLKAGFNFNDAAVSAKNVLFDYGDLSRIERRYLRDRGIFFYTFMRKNISLQAKTLLQQPGKQAFWSHVMGGTPAILGGEEDYPDWWREQIVSRPLAIPGIKTEEGEQLRFASMGMPLEEAFGGFAGPGYSPWSRAQRIAKRQFGKLTPLITTPTEFVSGQDIFYGKDISKMGYAPYFAGGATKIPYIGKPIKKAFDIREIGREGKPPYYTMSPQAAWLIRKSPLGRAWSSAQMLSQRGQPWPVRAMHFTLGQKPRIYDPEVMRERAEKKAISGLLEEKFRKGEVRQFKRFYVPKGMEKDKEMDLLLKSQ